MHCFYFDYIYRILDNIIQYQSWESIQQIWEIKGMEKSISTWFLLNFKDIAQKKYIEKNSFMELINLLFINTLTCTRNKIKQSIKKRLQESYRYEIRDHYPFEHIYYNNEKNEIKEYFEISSLLYILDDLYQNPIMMID